MYVQSLQCSNPGPITVKKAQDFTVTLHNGIDLPEVRNWRWEDSEAPAAE